MSVKDLLGKIIAGDREGAQEEFEQIMAEKASDGITEKRVEVAQSMFGEGKTPYENGKDDKEIEDKEAKDNEDEEDAKGDNDSEDDDEDESKDSEDDDEDDSEDDEEDKAGKKK